MNKAAHPQEKQYPQLKALWQEAFGDTMEDIETFWRTAFSPTRCLCITIENQVAAAAYWLDCSYHGGRLAYIYAVATAKASRGQGLCHQLLAGIHGLLQEQQYAGAVLVPGSPALAGLYQTMGYTHFGGIRQVSCTAGPPVALQELSPENYNLLRKQYLPEGGIVQEGESLAYLSEMASFYRGEDFLLAAAVRSGQAIGLELLGNSDSIRGITGALHCTCGIFRTFGCDSFGMWHPLKDIPAPTYLGFAFD